MNRNARFWSLAALAALLAVINAYGGGWSAITLKDTPGFAVAGKPLALTFTVRQHGNNLLSGLKPSIRATTPEGLETKAMAHDGD